MHEAIIGFPFCINRARQLEEQRGLTQTALANLAGLRQEPISTIETVHEATKLSSIYALFAALDLELVVDTRSCRPANNTGDIF